MSEIAFTTYRQAVTRVVKRVVEAFKDLSPQRQTAVCLVGIVVLLGVWMRTFGMWFSVVPLWTDESTWGLVIWKGDFKQFQFRPLGFMLLTKWLVKTFGYYEWALRFLPWLTGVLAVFLALPLVRLIYRSLAAQIFVVSAIALHPAAIDLAREFKPYSVAFFLHLGMLTGVLYCLRVRSSGALWGTLAFTLAGVLFSQDVVFAYPCVFLALGWQCLRERRFSQLWIVVAATLVTLGVVAAHYFLLWRFQVGPDNEAATFWGTKYNVFFTGTGVVKHLRWWVVTYADQATLAGLRTTEGNAPAVVQRAFHTVWIGLHVLGLLALIVQRRFNQLLLLVGPLLVHSVFNTLGLWPMGAFRASFFTLAYTIPIAGVALDWAAVNRLRGTLPTLLLILLPMAVYERDWHRWKTYLAYGMPIPEAVRTLVKLQGQDYQGEPEVVKVQAHLCSTWDYYTVYRPNHARLDRALEGRFKMICTAPRVSGFDAAKREIREKDRVWLVWNVPAPTTIESFKADLERRGLKVLAEQTMQGQETVVLLLGRGSN